MGSERRRKLSANLAMYNKIPTQENLRDTTEPKQRRRSQIVVGSSVQRPDMKGERQRRKTVSFFPGCDNISEINEEEEECDFKDHYRRTLLKLYEEQEIAKKTLNEVEKPFLDRFVQNRGPLDSFVQNEEPVRESYYLLTSFRKFVQDNELLLQVLIILPIILTIMYIIFVEEGSILKNV